VQLTEIIVIGEAAEIEGKSMGRESRQMECPAWKWPNATLSEFYLLFH